MRLRTFLRLAIGAPIVLIVVISLAVGVFWLRAERRLSRLEATWRTEIFDGREPLERYPVREPSPLARDLEELAGLAGISFEIDHRPEIIPPVAELAALWNEAVEPLKETLGELRAAERRSGLAIPAPVTTYLAAAHDPLWRARDRLLDGTEIPLWELDLSRGWEVRIANLLGVLHLHRAWMAAALEREGAGDRAEAERFLEAGWRLHQGPGADPLLISQLVSQGQLAEWLAVRRHVACMTADWDEPLQPRALRPAIERAFRLEGWMALYSMGQEPPPADLGGLERAPRFFRRLLVYHHAVSMERWAAMLPEEDARTLDPQVLFQDVEAQIPRWSVVSRLLVPNFLDAWTKAARAELEVEHVLLVLSLRDRLAGGSARDALGELPPLPSQAVDGAVWTRTRTPEGTRLEMDGPLPEAGEKPRMSLRYLVEPPRCDALPAAAG